MKGPNSQRGMTAIGWLIVLGLIAFFTLITLRLAPVYLEYSKVASVLEGLKNEPGITKLPKNDIRMMIDKRFYINEVNFVEAKQASIVQKGKVLTVKIEYERRVPMMGNIDVVAKFNKEIEVGAN